MFEHPVSGRVDQLLPLWKEAFGDHQGFWEMFLDTAFRPDHCGCLLKEDKIGASLCWLDCSWEGKKIAYIYAVVTHPDFRGQGLCRRLLNQVHRRLKDSGYAAAMLVPAEEALRQMYEKMGYVNCTGVSEFSCPPGETSFPLHAIGPEEYAQLRRQLLPRGSVLQEGENLSFLAEQAQFFAGPETLLAAYWDDGVLHALELLGNRNAAPGIVKTLDCREGRFRGPGEERPFAMIHPLTSLEEYPKYFGFAFD